jgi:hypothetical protein
MSGCQPCAPAGGVLIVSVRVLEYLCCLCGRHVACLLLSVSLSVCLSLLSNGHVYHNIGSLNKETIQIKKQVPRITGLLDFVYYTVF